MSSPAFQSIVAGTPHPRARCVLVLRSCRAAQFAAAVHLCRDRHPEAEIVALSHAGHDAALRAAGVDRIIEVPGRRFGLLRMSPLRLRRLRAERFDEVVIPQMTAYGAAHVNLYWLAAALGSPHLLVIPGERPPLAFDRQGFRAYARIHAATSLAALADAPLLLALLALAVVARMRKRPLEHRDRRRVLLVISSLGVGGAQVQIAELINRMPPDRFEVELLVFGNDGGFSRQWLKRPDVSTTFLEHWPHLSASVLEIAQRCRTRKYDIVHTWLFMANVVAVAGARLASVPIVITSVRNLSVYKRQAWYRKWWHRAADILGSNAADVVTVNARALVRDHSRWAWTRRSRVELVYNGLDPSCFLADRRECRRRLLDATGAHEDRVLVGTVGRLAPEKDQAGFLHLLAAVRRTRPDVHGVVVGDGELRAPLERLAEELGLAAAVSFVGERTDARRLMAGLDVFVLSSLSEGFPNVLLEATFLGVPCVATDIAGNPEVLVADEVLYPPGDIDAGAASIIRTLADPTRSGAFTRAARERALRLFTAERTVAAWLDVYSRAMARVRI